MNKLVNSINTMQKRLGHSAFSQPEDTTIKVWRYMDLAKFINIVLNKKLVFSRIDIHTDPFEGSITRKDYELRHELEIKNQEYFLKMNRKYDVEESVKNTAQRNLRKRETLYINCWRIDNHESEAMWKLYCPQNDGICIQTTYQKLVESLTDDDGIYIGQIKYIDYDTENLASGNLFSTIMHKRKAFEHEKEIRLVKAETKFWNLKEFQNDDFVVSIDWNLLNTIETIYVNPYASEWYFETIKGLLEKLDVNIDVKWSGLKSSPIY